LNNSRSLGSTITSLGMTEGFVISLKMTVWWWPYSGWQGGGYVLAQEDRGVYVLAREDRGGYVLAREDRWLDFGWPKKTMGFNPRM